MNRSMNNIAPGIATLAFGITIAFGFFYYSHSLMFRNGVLVKGALPRAADSIRGLLETALKHSEANGNHLR